jgi:hypothetical protein
MNLKPQGFTRAVARQTRILPGPPVFNPSGLPEFSIFRCFAQHNR